MDNYRQLSKQEINTLKENGCSADSWANIEVVNNFTPNYITSTIFSGKIRLGTLEKEYQLPGGLTKHACIHRAIIHNCDIGNDVVIENIQNYIANYTIGNNCFIQNVDVMFVNGISTFGNGVKVSVLDETGGREVYIHNKLSSHFAYIYTLYRHRPRLIENMCAMVERYCNKHASDKGVVGDNCTIVNVGYIKNVNVGAHCKIMGAMELKNGTINSNAYAPVKMGRNVIVEDFIISSDSRVESGAILKRCFVGQACTLKQNYSASDSLFFSNSQGMNGEACALFAGPFTVTHHKSTLLIAGMFSFMNAGSGSNQSNHMYKLGPIHQGIVERGAKTTSNSYVLWPAKVGPFSLILGRHHNHADTSDLPFSYLIEKDNTTHIVPGVNLRSVGTIRDAKKWPERDFRNDPNELDYINFNLLSPYTLQKVLAGIKILTNLQTTAGETSAIYTFQSCIISNSSLKRGLKLYDMVVHKFLGNSLIKRLEHTQFENDAEIRGRLQPISSVGIGEWVDLSGLIAPKSQVDLLISKIENGEIDKLREVSEVFSTLHNNYYTLEWTWAWQKIQEYYNIDAASITSTDVIEIVEKWKKAVIELDEMIYEDAKKEFSLSFKTGFGADGNVQERILDFESVRGAFDNNEFVVTVLKHIKDKRALGDELIARMKQVERKDG